MKNSRKTKIVCTIGPASRSPEKIEALIGAGMNVARLNFSHGTQDEHAENIRRIREISGRMGEPVAILQDLAGPKIRIGVIGEEPVRLESGFVEQKQGVSQGDRDTKYPVIGQDRDCYHRRHSLHCHPGRSTMQCNSIKSYS